MPIRFERRLKRALAAGTLALAGGGLAPASEVAAPAGAPLLRILPAGRAIDARLRDAAGETFAVRLRAGERAAVRVSATDGPLMLVLADPAGVERRRRVREVDPAAGSACRRADRPELAWVAATPAEAGAWTVKLLPPEGAPPIAVTLRREAPRAAGAADRIAWQAEESDEKVARLLEAGRQPDAVAAAADLVALRAREMVRDPVGLASDDGWLGVAFYGAAACASGAWDLSLDLVRRALALRAGALPPGDLCVAESESLVASILYARGEYEEGEAHEKRALAIRTAAGPAGDATRRTSLRDVGLLLLKQGKYAEAAGYFERALDEARRIAPADPVAVADARHHLGELYRSQDRHADARREFDAAAALLVAEGAPIDAALLADVTGSLAGLDLDAARYDDAERAARRVLHLFEADPAAATPERAVIARNNLGEILRRQGRLEEARPILETALADGREALCPDNPTLLFFRINLAMLHAGEKRFDAADALYAESLAAQETALGPEHPNVAENLHDWALMRLDAGQPAEAADLLERARAIRAAAYGDDHPLTAATRVTLARARRDAGTAPPEALLEAVAADAVLLRAAAAAPEAAIDARRLEADLLDQLGRRAEATRALAAALDGIETLRPRRGAGEQARTRYLGAHLDDYDRMIAWRVEAGDLAGAFDALERSRARAFLDRLAAGSADPASGIDPALRARLGAAEATAGAALAEAQARAAFERGRADLPASGRRQRAAALDREADAAALRLRQATDELRNNSPAWREALTAGGGVVGLQAVRAPLVAEGGWLLHYRVGRGRALLLAVPASGGASQGAWLTIEPGDAAALGIPPGPLTATALESIVAGAGPAGAPPLARRIAAPPSPADDVAGTTAALAALRRVLLPDAIWRKIRRAPEIVVVPDGALAQIPFEALALKPGADWRRARLLIDDGPVVRYAASATSLANLARRASPPGAAPGVLSVSDPDYQGLRPRLPGTARESAAVAAAFAAAGFPDAVVILEGKGASEPAVRAAIAGRRYLHLATHGFVDPRRSDLLAGLVLSPSGDAAAGAAGDGLWQWFEIDAASIEAALVVLSACDTGVGRRVEGEGSLSLARAFFAAGAARVLATLWPVADASTADLVGDLFGRIAAREAAGDAPRPADDLLAARRRLRAVDATAAPFYWGGFILMGAR